MDVHPAIAALRADRAPQRRAQTAMAAAQDGWRAEPRTAPVLADLARFGRGEVLARCHALRAAITDRASGMAVAEALCRHVCAAMVREPLGHPALRHAHDGRVSSLLLAREGRAHLMLHAREPGPREFDSALFSDAERHELVLAGSGRARRLRLAADGGMEIVPWMLGPGDAAALDLSREALQVLDAGTRLVSLRLERRADHPMPTRQHALSGGAPIHRAAGDVLTSRREATIALLGRMKRTEAAPAMADLAREPGDASLRWQALRECLALDTAEGFAALSAVARAADDALSEAAGALRARLIEAHPELARMEDGRCPA